MPAQSEQAKKKLKENQRKYASSPRGKWAQQKAQAKSRGIEFSLTFEEWQKIWTDSGKYDKRGKGLDEYCMSRKGDAGGYTVDNVEIVVVRKNLEEQVYSGAHSTARFKVADHERLRKLDSEGMNQDEIAVAIDCSQSYVSRVLGGKRGKLFIS